MKNLIDEVQELHEELWEERQDYRLLFEAVSRSEAVEGSLSAENVQTDDGAGTCPVPVWHQRSSVEAGPGRWGQ